MKTGYIKINMPRSDEALAELADAGTLGVEEDGERFVAWFSADALSGDMKALAEKFGGVITTEEAVDWSVKWREGIRPLHIGPLVVTPPWLATAWPATPFSATPSPAESVNARERIIIDSGMAFGTGDHATTRGCLSLLVRTVRQGAQVLDFGCGAGILAIAAMKLGAAAATAVDCDANAVAIAASNARVNDVLITTAVAETPPDGAFDLVVANIQSSVLMPLFESLRARVRPDGWLIIGGILSDEILPTSVIGSLSDADYRIVDAGWQTLAWKIKEQKMELGDHENAI